MNIQKGKKTILCCAEAQLRWKLALSTDPLFS